MIFNQKKGYSTDFFGPYKHCLHCHSLSLAEHGGVGTASTYYLLLHVSGKHWLFALLNNKK